MDVPRKVRRARYVIRALLAASCMLVIPKFALSEPNTPGNQQDVLSKGPSRDPFVGGGRPMRMGSRLFPDGDDCAVAKVDIWLERGALTHSVFLAGKSPGQIHRAFAGGPDGTTLLIGEKDCMVRIRIERATDASAYDWEGVKRLRDAIKEAR
jgi:hypothetical protein